VSAADITRILHVQPTQMNEIGDPVSARLPGKLRTSATWRLESSASNAESLSTHIANLLRQIGDQNEAVRSLAATCDVDLFCGVFLEDDTAQCSLSVDMLQRIVPLGADVVLNLYLPGIPHPDQKWASIVRYPAHNVPRPDLNDQWRWPDAPDTLQQRLLKCLDSIETTVSEKIGNGTVDIHFATGSGQGELCLSHQTLTRLTALDLGLNLIVYDAALRERFINAIVPPRSSPPDSK